MGLNVTSKSIHKGTQNIPIDFSVTLSRSARTQGARSVGTAIVLSSHV